MLVELYWTVSVVSYKLKQHYLENSYFGCSKYNYTAVHGDVNRESCSTSKRGTKLTEPEHGIIISTAGEGNTFTTTFVAGSRH